jgi:prepilin-type processing-associated H-X9-DG protein
VFIALLPFLEQNSLYDAWQAIPGDNRPYNDTPAVNAVFNTRLAVLGCPSDAGTKSPILSCNTPTSYHVSYGDWPTYSVSSWGNHKTKNPRGVFSVCHVDRRSIASIHDGTSNTLAFGEVVIGYEKSIGYTSVKGNTKYNLNSMGNPLGDPGTASVTSPETNFNAQTCWNTNLGAKNYISDTNINRHPDGQIGRRWGDSAMPYTGLMTIFPPNHGPSCFAGSAELSLSVITSTSNHPGGVNIGLADGSARFTNDSINALSPGIPTNYSTPTGMTTLITGGGESRFGVWGALGSIAGGDNNQNTP